MRRITVRGIIVRDGKLFAQKLKKHDDVNDYWATPGGELDQHESLLNGLTREMIEETGITPTIGELMYIQQYSDEDGEYLEFFFRILNADEYQHIDLAATSHGEQEVAECGFIDPAASYVLPAFLQQENLSDLPQTPKLVSYL